MQSDNTLVGDRIAVGEYAVQASVYRPDLSERYEYRLRLWRDGKWLDIWDSNVETYNGIQTFDKSAAVEAAKTALAEIEAGEGGDYFSLLKTSEED